MAEIDADFRRDHDLAEAIHGANDATGSVDDTPQICVGIRLFDWPGGWRAGNLPHHPFGPLATELSDATVHPAGIGRDA
jgi:hypothetical protein